MGTWVPSNQRTHGIKQVVLCLIDSAALLEGRSAEFEKSELCATFNVSRARIRIWPDSLGKAEVQGLGISSVSMGGHYDRRAALMLGRIESRASIGLIEHGGGTSFTLEAFPSFRVPGDRL